MNNYDVGRRYNKNGQDLAAGGRPGESIAMHLKRFRNNLPRGSMGGADSSKGLSLEEFSEYLCKNGLQISAQTLRNYEAGRRIPTMETAVDLARIMGMSLDAFILGIPTSLISAQKATGLSSTALKNLSCIKKAHHDVNDADNQVLDDIENTYSHRFSDNFLRLIDSLLSNEQFLGALDYHVQRLIDADICRQTRGCDENPERYYEPERIEFVLTKVFIEAVRQCANRIIEPEVKRIRHEEVV